MTKYRYAFAGKCTSVDRLRKRPDLYPVSHRREDSVSAEVDSGDVATT